MKRIVALIIAATLFFVGIGFSFMNMMLSADIDRFMQTDFIDEVPKSTYEMGAPTNKVAIVNVEGEIMNQPASTFGAVGYNHELTLEALKEIRDDASISAVLLHVDSPGGGVYESAELHKLLVEIKEQDKTIYSTMGNMAASGGYYISAPADKIFASRETLTGSIGVIMSGFNASELMDNLGIEETTWASGDMKNMGSMFTPMTEEEDEYFQYLTDSMHDDFVQVIVEGRDMDESDVRDLADGRIYLAEDAIENGLVDEIGNFDDALAALKEEVGENAQVIEYGMPEANPLFGIPIPGIKQTLGSLLFEDHASQLDYIQYLNVHPRPMYLYNE